MSRPLHPWLEPLREAFEARRCAENAAAMQAYMKDIAPFFGLKTPLRRALLKEHLSRCGRPAVQELPAIVRSAFAQPEREWHYTAVDLLVRQAKQLGPEHLPLLEELITTKSWWDTVDALAANVVGVVLKRYPTEIPAWSTRWIESPD
ncbi:MAG: DNA alkylation repair protein, partial [Flavobacteriales bacterium]|nr:DNA alkylation repair protein [Flavobacteriales bacterium]